MKYAIKRFYQDTYLSDEDCFMNIIYAKFYTKEEALNKISEMDENEIVVLIPILSKETATKALKTIKEK